MFEFFFLHITCKERHTKNHENFKRKPLLYYLGSFWDFCSKFVPFIYPQKKSQCLEDKKKRKINSIHHFSEKISLFHDRSNNHQTSLSQYAFIFYCILSVCTRKQNKNSKYLLRMIIP